MKSLFNLLLVVGGGVLVSSAQAATFIQDGDFGKSNLSGSVSQWDGNTLPNSSISGDDVSFNESLTFRESTINWVLDGTWTITGNVVFNNGYRVQDGIASHTTLNLGTNGKLAVNGVLNFSNASQLLDSTFNVYATLTGTAGTMYHRTLFSSTSNQIWNVEAFTSGNLSDHFKFQGYTVSDQVLSVGYSIDDLADGVAYIYYDSFDGSGHPASVSVVYKGAGASIPEPSTAVLSILGLAGLCLRRRRA